MGLTDASGPLVSIYAQEKDVMFAKFYSRVQIHKEAVEMLREILHVAWNKESAKQGLTSNIGLAKRVHKMQKWCICEFSVFFHSISGDVVVEDIIIDSEKNVTTCSVAISSFGPRPLR
jgi:hypothetical protein